MRTLFFSLFLILPSLLFATVLTGQVVKITDGDTFVLLDKNRNQIKIRLDGIDAPEKNQAYGNKAKQYLSSMIWGVPVKVNVTKKDRYGRSIGKVSTAKFKDVNLEMIKAGYAWHYKEYNQDKSYASAETNARKKRLGLWQDKNPVYPQNFRKKRIFKRNNKFLSRSIYS